jgi:multidrug transporter EmrE-like cation transporter
VLLAGVGCFALNVGFYAYALRKMPISVAYPIMVTAGFVIIVLVAGMFLKERLTAWQWSGVAAVLIGVTLVAKDAAVQMGAETEGATSAPARAEGHESVGPEH